METLTLKPREPVKEEIECWDDDDDLQGIDDLQFRNVSTTTVGTSTSTHVSHHRDSVSSRLSARSDFDGDEDWQVLLPADDEKSTSNAIASAKSAGIPIPSNVPTSALLGGTIKRLGGRRLKKVLGDDWSEDLELPKAEEGGLKLKKHDGKDFPDALRQISAAFMKIPSPAEPANMSFVDRLRSAGKARATVASLDKFRDDLEDDFGNVPTIKVAKGRSPMKMINFSPSPVKAAKAVKEPENFEDDLEFPIGEEPLKLSARKEVPKTPASHLQEDFDADWAEGSQGSLGTSIGGTRRTGRSNRSSSISALSPSVFSPSLSSCLTAESEDEGLEGLVLPDGPLKFEEVLKKRIENASPDPTDGKKPEVRAAAKEDFFSGIEIGDGDVFDSGKLTLNRNIKHKAARSTSPARRTQTTLTFTNKIQSTTTRIPRLQTHDRARSKLEPVSESGGPIADYRRAQSRLGSHSTQSSASSIPTPSTPSFPPASGPSTPSRRALNTKSSRDVMKPDPPTTTGTQLLKAKRSMPVMRSQPSPARNQPSYQRPPSRLDQAPRASISSRPRTPDRFIGEPSVSSARKPQIPFLPAGNSQAQSHHINNKLARNAHRPNSSDSSENMPFNRPISRLSNPHYRPHTPSSRRDVAPDYLAREAASKRTLTKPTRRRAFGDGNELDIFDDLPTSATIESKFIKHPVARGTVKPSNLRNKLNSSQNASVSSLAKIETSGPQTPLSPQKNDNNIPRFARDTAASRLAREQRVGSLNPLALRTLNSSESNTSLAPPSSHWKPHLSSKSLASPRHTAKRQNKPQQKPYLIKDFGNSGSEPKSYKGMHWNPQLFRWEGNEHALAPFDIPLPNTPDSPRVTGLGIQTKPALIANVGSVKGVQVVGGMVFDPQRMCWLKMAPNHAGRGRSDSGGMSPATEDDEEDPFAGLDDLDDGNKKGGAGVHGGKDGPGNDEWLVGEEFDIGPEFIKRQRAEEEKWRRKVEHWVKDGSQRTEGDEWKWAVRTLVGK